MITKRIVVTGAANGIGYAVVKKYLDLDVREIIAIDIDGASLNKIDNSHSTTLLTRIPIDLMEFNRLENVIKPILLKKNSIDIVVICHGVADENEINDNCVWRKVIDVNLNATRNLLSILDDYMIDGGSVVIVSSILGKVGKRKNTAYCTSKHGLLGLMKSLALDWASRGVRVNAVLPSWVDSPMLRREIKKQADLIGSDIDRMMRRVKRDIPLKKLISVDDVADSILFFSSSSAKMITAQSCVIDGGYGCGV